jgi:prepilin signal peptidase PulO-like enzyme (type II secretory pathway)
VQYPLVELATGILFVLNFWYWLGTANSLPELVLSVGLTTSILACLVVIFVYDLRHKIIPDLFSFTAWGLSIVYVVAQALVSVIPAKAGIQVYRAWIPAFAGMTTAGTWVTTLFAVIPNILAGLFFYAIIWAIWRLSKGRMIGLGDAKLLLTIGTLLGFVLALSAIFISVWIATVYAGYLLLKQYLNKKGKHITMKTEIPFGPFLIIGFLIVYFTQIDVTNIGMILEHIYEL